MIYILFLFRFNASGGVTSASGFSGIALNNLKGHLSLLVDRSKGDELSHQFIVESNFVLVQGSCCRTKIICQISIVIDIYSSIVRCEQCDPITD